jgi:hypothetical protein
VVLALYLWKSCGKLGKSGLPQPRIRHRIALARDLTAA